jgi:hypothetical protein
VRLEADAEGAGAADALGVAEGVLGALADEAVARAELDALVVGATVAAVHGVAGLSVARCAAASVAELDVEVDAEGAVGRRASIAWPSELAAGTCTID